MGWAPQRVLVIGATAGIGAAMADRLVNEGSKVIAVGRRQDRLDAFVEKHGSDKAAAVRFDLSDRANIKNFVTTVTNNYPNVDCVFLNAGVQRPFDLSQPEKIDLDSFHNEVSINFSSYVDLTVKILPFLLKKTIETSIIFTGSDLAIVPASNLSAYSASKAALNAFILCLRDQLRNSSVRIIEVSPPLVQTELHDYMPSGKGRQLGMPLNAFTDAAYEGLASAKDQIVIGAIGPADTFNQIIDNRRAAFENLSKMIRGEH